GVAGYLFILGGFWVFDSWGFMTLGLAAISVALFFPVWGATAGGRLNDSVPAELGSSGRYRLVVS
ncbi:hypothetical protein, partial [Nocardia cyriacigeorgica]|uniref:hypothetical protein n=1 Tax=Nocardia cyriacigeorgica TaxID=135487 RepID=UPI00245502BE